MILDKDNGPVPEIPGQDRFGERAARQGLLMFFFHRIILQGGEPFFPRADLDDVVHGRDENLSIAVTTGVERFLGSVDDRADRDGGDHDVDLYFGRRRAGTLAPRYISRYPRWIPNPLTSVAVNPVMPISSMAVFKAWKRSRDVMMVTRE